MMKQSLFKNQVYLDLKKLRLWNLIRIKVNIKIIN